MEEFILGIDDSGRGPVIGPMILAGCIIKKDSERELKKIGVKDSKELTHKRREFISEKIRRIAEGFEIVVVHPEEIDSHSKTPENLNDLEAKKAAEIINRLNTGEIKLKVVIDCPSPNRTKWGNYLKMHIENLSNLEIVCEHKADKNHVAVSAASILAKSRREEEMDKIRKKYGNVGSGYTSDPVTIRFLEKNILELKDTGIFRKSWTTWKKIYLDAGQKRLVGF